MPEDPLGKISLNIPPEFSKKIADKLLSKPPVIVPNIITEKVEQQHKEICNTIDEYRKHKRIKDILLFYIALIGGIAGLLSLIINILVNWNTIIGFIHNIIIKLL